MPQRKGVENHTVGSGFILLGFADHSSLQGLCFPVFLLICLVVLTGNSLIALTTAVDSSLHSPMDFFLRNLSLLEICYLSVTAKKAGGFPDGRWQDLLPRLCCPAVCCPGFVGQDQMLLLAALAYDCYIAKCDCCVKRATVR
ncbi:hypothetical protein QYF61_020461 [Mycteria americana]|uniref:Uncharacterized protein n=1 Tax=Mycteria americana TaxID=33587 RepID=A0AAN7N1Y9_MYCAM|nr:hypothetical protein QYF61_020461 [Mycteria americana]